MMITAVSYLVIQVGKIIFYALTLFVYCILYT